MLIDSMELKAEIILNRMCETPKTLEEIIDDVPGIGWVNVDDEMPQKTGYYLIRYTRSICMPEMAVAFYSVEEKELDSKYSWEFKPFGDVKKVTHWMELPEQPQERGDNA